MTDSLIPYTFVPGTKARASEVNANFAAVAEAINTSNAAISTLSSNTDTAIASRLDLTMSNSHNVTNCIVSAPNGVASYSGLTITVKSGLKVLIPNGRNSDGSLKNTLYTLNSDQTAVETDAAGDKLFALKSNGDVVLFPVSKYGFGLDSDKPATLDDVNLHVYFSTDTNKIYTSIGSTTPNWTETPMCLLGEYSVLNSAITTFKQYSCLNLSNPANFNLSNLTSIGESHFLRPSDINEIRSWNMPDYANGITVSANADYTAPSDGFISYTPVSNSYDQTSIAMAGIAGYIAIAGKTVLTITYTSGVDAGHPDSGFFPVSSGESIYHTMGAGTVYFYPCKGV